MHFARLLNALKEEVILSLQRFELYTIEMNERENNHKNLAQSSTENRIQEKNMVVSLCIAKERKAQKKTISIAINWALEATA